MALIAFFIIFICLFFILGILPYEDKTKKCVIPKLAIVYNLIFGFYDILFYEIYRFVYAGSFIKDIIEFILIYLLLRIPINIIFKLRGKINIKKYLSISVFSTFAGLVLYFIIMFALEKLGVNILAL